MTQLGGKKEKYHYVVEKLDAEGIKGDLVKKYQGKKLIAQKFVPADKMKMIANDAKEAEENAIKENKSSPKTQVVYKKEPSANKPVIVKDETNFGQHVKAGLGFGVGFVAVNAIFNGLGELFD